MYLIKNTIVYAPKCLGKKDVLIGGGKRGVIYVSD